MYLIKPLSLVFLAVYLLVVGLTGFGVNLGFVTPGVLGFFAVVAGVLFLVRAVKCFTCCKTCDRPPYDDKS